MERRHTHGGNRDSVAFYQAELFYHHMQNELAVQELRQYRENERHSFFHSMMRK